MALAPIVELYRKAGKPTIVNGVFASHLAFTPDVRASITPVFNSYPHQFDEILVDGIEITTEQELSEQANQIEFVFRLQTGSDNKFYSSLTSLITENPKISRGEIPSEFYLIEEDYFSNDNVKLERLESLDIICQLIKGLSELAHYHDEKANAGHYRLIFIQTEDLSQAAAKAIEIDTTISIDMLDGCLPDISLVESLRADNPKIDPHYSSKVGVFRASLAEFLQKAPSGKPTFAFLVSGWSDFLETFNKNLNTYLSGFAFHKAKREVAEAELKIADDFSKIIIDITGKLLGIPISLAAIIAITKSASSLDSLLIVTGLGLTTLIFSGTVGNQQRQLRRIGHAKNIIFNAFEGKEDVYPADLRSQILEMKLGLNKNESKLKWLLWLFRGLSWAPFILGVITFYIFCI